MSRVWSTYYDSYVSESYSHRKRETLLNPDISNCIIRVSPMGFFFLYYKSKRIRQISFQEYLDYRDYVLEVEGEELIKFDYVREEL